MLAANLVQNLPIGRLTPRNKNDLIKVDYEFGQILVAVGYLAADGIVGFQVVPPLQKVVFYVVKLFHAFGSLAVQRNVVRQFYVIQFGYILENDGLIIGLTG